MARTLCPDRERASIAVLSALIILFSTSSIAQIGAIVLGGVFGLVALPRCAAGGGRSHRHAGLAPRRARGADGLSSSCSSACRSRSSDASAGRRAVRRFLSLRRAGLWRRPCGAAAVARGVRRARLGQRRCVSRRLRRGAGGAGTALHLCRLSRRGRQSVAARHRRRGAGSVRHFPSRHADPSRRAAVLGQLSQARRTRKP